MPENEPPELDRSASRPLYLQARDALLSLIETSGVGDVLPRERDLAVAWGVSRITIRNAYVRLVDEGYVMKTHKAYKVAPRLSSTGLFMLEGFTKDAQQRGNQPRTEVLGLELIYPEAEIAEVLLLPERGRTYRLARKRFLNEELIAIEYAYLSETLTPALDSYKIESLYELLDRQYNLRVQWAQQHFRFCFDDIPEREIMGISEGIPLLHLKRVSFSNANHPIEYVEAFYHLRHFEFYLEIRK